MAAPKSSPPTSSANEKRYPRAVAVRILARVLSDHEPLDEALAAVSGEVTPEGRAWLQEVCSGTLRWKGRLDQAIDAIALKKKPTGWLRRAILVGAYQLVGQDRTSPGATVSETVNIIKKKEGEAPAKFANALLRRIAEDAERWRALPFPERGKPESDEAASWASLPEWLWKRIVRDRGIEWSRAYAQASLERPQIWIRGRDAKTPPLEGAEAGPVAGSWRSPPQSSGAVHRWDGFVEGRFFVQDISSQTLVDGISAEVKRACGSKTPRALDLCAAPGGKSVGLAWSGIDVTATDRDETRVALLRQTVERVAPEVKIVPRAAIDALELQDLVWVDSPCSGTGILRRHPDVRWLRQERELASLALVQLELLREGWSKVRPGGFLAFSVCSVLVEEGADAVARAGLTGATEIKRWELAPQLEPYGDGFWAVLLQKS